MKRCPTCDRVYEDDSLSFCLEDGATLVPESAFDPGATVKIPAGRLTNQAPTEVLKEETIPPTQPAASPAQRYVAPPPAAPSEQKKSALPWILGAALILGLSAIAVAWIVTRNNGSDNGQVAQQNAQTESSPSPGATPSTQSGVEGTTGKTENPTFPTAPTPAVGTNGTAQPGKTPEQPAGTPKPTPSVKGGGPTDISAPSTPEPKPTPTPARPSGPISGGVLNGKATSLPKPAYPPIARAAHASGTVSVQVIIDESGKVISAKAVSGHPLLQQAAVQAAYQARFSPTMLSGQPVKVTGVITYNFVAQ